MTYRDVRIENCSHFFAPRSAAPCVLGARYHLLLVITGGKTWSRYGDEVLSAAQGDAVLHPGGVTYEEWTCVEEPMSCRKVLFWTDGPVSALPRKITDSHGLIGQLSKRLHEVFWRGEKQKGEVSDLLLRGVLGEYIALAGEEVPLLVEQVRAYTRDRIDTWFGLGTLSAHFGYNRHYFIRKFKCEAGHGPMREVRNTRLAVARELALTTDLQVKGIAGRVGIADASYLSRIFRQQYGQTIRALRAVSRRL